jgi:hypothetical protein
MVSVETFEIPGDLSKRQARLGRWLERLSEESRYRHVVLALVRQPHRRLAEGL